MTTPLAIEATGLVKLYGTKAALDGVDISVPTGTVTAVLGPNGAGKTTAVRILTTLSDATAGTATVAGFDVATQANEVRRRIGLAAQDATIDPLLTGRENLVMIGELHQLGRGEAKTRAVELLEQFDLTDAAEQVTSGYSGGMRRRLDLAATLVARPQVLFLDEPTTGLDPRARNELWIVLDTLVGQGHDAAAHHAVPRRGRPPRRRHPGRRPRQGHRPRRRPQPQAPGRRRQHRRDRRRPRRPGPHRRAARAAAPTATRWSTAPLRTVTAPTSAGVAGLASVANTLAGAGLRVEDLSLRQPTLDEVFLTLTGVAIDHDDELEEARA